MPLIAPHTQRHPCSRMITSAAPLRLQTHSLYGGACVQYASGADKDEMDSLSADVAAFSAWQQHQQLRWAHVWLSQRHAWRVHTSATPLRHPARCAACAVYQRLSMRQTHQVQHQVIHSQPCNACGVRLKPKRGQVDRSVQGVPLAGQQPACGDLPAAGAPHACALLLHRLLPGPAPQRGRATALQSVYPQSLSGDSCNTSCLGHSRWSWLCPKALGCCTRNSLDCCGDTLPKWTVQRGQSRPSMTSLQACRLSGEIPGRT